MSPSGHGIAKPPDMIGPAGQTARASTGALLVRGSALNVATLIAGVAVSFFLMPFLIHAAFCTTGSAGLTGVSKAQCFW